MVGYNEQTKIYIENYYIIGRSNFRCIPLKLRKFIENLCVREAAKKTLFSGPTTKALTPPPPA